MNCAEFESILADYVDGTLPASERVAVDLHSAECAACRQFMSEVVGMAAMLEHVDDVEPPAELITRIAYQSPQGRTRDPFDVYGFWSELKSKWLDPFLQPRLAMSMAMTVLSFAMLARCTGAPVQHLQAADLNPGRVLANFEDRILRGRDRVVKNYENLRVVYEIESRLSELEQQSPASETATPDTKGQQSAPAATRDQQGARK